MNKAPLILLSLLLSIPGEALTLQWAPPVHKLTEGTRFYIYRQDNCEGHYILNGIVFYPTNTFTDTSAEKGKIYCYIVTTSDGVNESPYGDYIRVENKD